MKLAGLVGFFRLSPLGETIFRDAGGLKEPWFETQVVEEGEKGLLVRLLDEPEPTGQGYMVLLLKWEYIATARFRYDV